MTIETLAEEIAWLSNEDLDKLVDLLAKAYPTRATRMEQSIAAWRVKVTAKPSPVSISKPKEVGWWWTSKFQEKIMLTGFIIGVWLGVILGISIMALAKMNK